MTNDPKKAMSEDPRDAQGGTPTQAQDLADQLDTSLPEDPSEAEPGRGAPGDNHYGVQTAQTTKVNAPDAIIPGNTDTELNEEQLEAFEEQEEQVDFTTTDGYVEDESGRLDNYAIEPPMYYEDQAPPTT